MKVICTEIDPDCFSVGEDHKAYFKAKFGMGKIPKVFDRLQVGQVYTVYALKISKGYPWYFVERKRWPGPWSFQPSMCFDIIDPRASRHWCFDSRLYRAPRGEEWFYSIMAIKEWIYEPTFFERLVDGEERERAIMTAAASEMDREFD